MFSPPRELKDSFLSFQATDTSVEPHPESDQFTVPNQHLAKQMTPPRKLPENILKLNGDQNQSPQFRSISSLDQAADEQLFEMLVPSLDSESSSITKFIASPHKIEKHLVQHRTLARKVVGATKQFAKPQLQKKTVEDGYRDPNMNEGYANSLRLQSQGNQGEPPKPSGQIEQPEYLLEAQTQDSENLGMVQESPDRLPLLPEEDKPSVQKEGPLQHHFASRKAIAVKHHDRNAPSPNRNEAQYSKLPNVTVKPVDLEITVIPEAEKKTQHTLSQQQAPGHLPASPEEVGPSSTQQDLVHFSEGPEEIGTALTQQEATAPNPELSEELESSLGRQEALSESLELPEDLEASGSQLEVPALPTKPPEEVNPPIEQEATNPTPEPSMPGIIETPVATVSHRSQDQVQHYILPTITVNPADVEVIVTSKPFNEAETSPVQEETQTPGPRVKAGHYSLEQQPAEPSESSGQIESPERYLESSTQPPEEEEEEEEEEESSLTQEDVPAQYPSPLLEGESSPIELQQPIQPSESPEEVGLGPENQSEASVIHAEFPEEVKSPVEQEVPLQAPESPFETIVETPPIHKVWPAPNKVYHYHLPNVTIRPVDLELTIISEPTKEAESSLAHQEFSVQPSEYTEEGDSFPYEQEQLVQPSELKILTQASEHHHLASSTSTHPQTHHSLSPSTIVKPPDVQLTIAQNPTAEVEPPPVLHEVVGKPIAISDKVVNTSTTYHTNPAVTPAPSEEVEFLSNQEKAPVQSAESVQYKKPSLSQQGSTDENSELLEEVEPSSAQQETPVNPLVFPNEMIVQPSAHHEATGPPLIHTQLHPPASHSVTAKPQELTSEVETSSQQGFEPSEDQQEEVTSQYPTPLENHQDSSVYQGVLTQPAKLPGQVSSGQQGNLSPPPKHPPGVQFLPFHQGLPDQHLEPPKEGFFLSPIADTLFFSPDDLEAIFRYELSRLHKTTVLHLNQAHARAPGSSMEVESLQVQEEDVVPIPVIPTEQIEYSQVQFEYPSHTPEFPETQFSQQQSIAQKTDFHEEAYTFPTQQRGLYLPPDSIIGAELSPAQHMSWSQPEDISENVGLSLVLQPTLAQDSEPPKEIVFSPTQQVLLNQLPELMNNIVTHLPTQQMTVPISGQIQAEYPTAHTISFQGSNLEFAITSQYTPEADHTTEPPPTNPQVTFPSSTEVTVEPLDLGLTISPQSTPEELSQTMSETTTQITEPPREVVTPAPLYQKMTVPTPGQDRVKYPIPPAVSFQPLDSKLTISSEPTREIQQPTTTMKITGPPPEHLQDYVPYVTEVTVQPLDMSLTISPQSTPEELSQTMSETTTQITEPPREVVAPASLYQETTIPTVGQDRVEYPIPPAVSFQPLDLKLAVSSEPTREVHHSTTPKETTVPPPKSPQVTLPQEFHIQNLYPSEVTVQPLDLELTITPQPNPKALPQTMSESTIQITKSPKEVVAQLYQEVTVPTPSEDQTKYLTLPVASFHPLDLELTISSEPTREIQRPTITMKITGPPPEHLQDYVPYVTEVTVQPLDLELNITPQSTPKELPQTMSETTPQTTEPPREVVAPASLYQEMTVSTPGQVQNEHLTTLQPVNLELTTTSDSTTEAEHSTTLSMTTVPSPKYSQMTLPEQVLFQHPNPTDITVQSLDLGLTTISQPDTEGELSQTTQESTTQPTDPPKEAVTQAPVYQEVTLATSSKDAVENPTLPIITFQLLDLDLTIHPEPSREAHNLTTLKETTILPPTYSQVTLPEQVHTQHPHPSEVTFQHLDLELSMSPQPTPEVELSQTVQETKTQPSDPAKEVVTPAPGYPEVTVQTPDQDKTAYLIMPATSFQPLDLEFISSGPTTPHESPVSPPQYHQMALSEQVYIQHPNLTKVTVLSLDLELTVIPSPNLNVETSPHLQEILPEPEQPHEEVTAKAPVFYEITPIQDPTRHLVSPKVTVQHIKVEHGIAPISSVETELLPATYNITAHHEMTLPPVGQVQALHGNPTQVTTEPSYPEFSIAPPPATMVKRSVPVQSTESSKETVVQSPVHLKVTVLAIVHGQPQHLNSEATQSEVPATTHPETVYSIALTTTHPETTYSTGPTAMSPPSTHYEVILSPSSQVQTHQPKPTEVTTWSSPTSQQSSTTPQSVTLVSPFAPMLQITAQQIPSGITLEPVDLGPTINPYAGNFNREKDLIFQKKPNGSMSTNICDFCLCENHTLLCNHLSPMWKLHQVPVPSPNTYKGTLNVL